MQLQMEVCGLDECDFLETKFVECDETEYFDSINRNNNYKGVILYFHATDGKPFYKYMPFHIKSPSDIDYWQEQMIELYQSAEYKYIWIKTYYWKLEFLSCVLVCRNRQWFNDNIAEIAEIWSTVVKERITGYEHRAPNRKPKPVNAFQMLTKPPSKCLLKFVNKSYNATTDTDTDTDTNIITATNITATAPKCLLKFVKKPITTTDDITATTALIVKDLQLNV